MTLRVPAEWETHARTWMLWPSRADNWRSGAWPAQQAFSRVARAMATFEPVTLGADARWLPLVRTHFQDEPAIQVVEISSNDAWMRDMGPTIGFDEGGGRVGIDWVFNSWGGDHNGLYSPWDLDDQVAASVLAQVGVRRVRSEWVMEGGALHFDGEGTLLTTAECLLDPGRNPGLSQQAIEQALCETLGVERVLWLPWGVSDDETNGHVDNVACFVKPGEVLLAWTDDPDHPDYHRCRENRAYLESQTDAQGRLLTVHPMPLPPRMSLPEDVAAQIYPREGTQPRQAGDPLAASYVNFYLCNGGLIMPTFGVPEDTEAQNRLAALFPERTVVPVPSIEILYGGGNIHCITLQEPLGLPPE